MTLPDSASTPGMPVRGNGSGGGNGGRNDSGSVDNRWSAPVPRRGPPPPQVTDREAEPNDPPALTAALVSTILHTVALIILALLRLAEPDAQRQTLVVSFGASSDAPSISANLVTAVPTTDPGPEGENARLLPNQAIKTELTPGEVIDQLSSVSSTSSPKRSMESMVPSFAIEPKPTAAELPPLILLSPDQSEQFSRLPSSGLSGRTPQRRRELGDLYGATAASEKAVEEGLRWIAQHQRDDGSWSFNLELDPCNGRCRNSTVGGDSPAPSTAATGLALLAFLGAGHTHLDDGPYHENIRKGIYYLRAVAAETESGYDWQKGSMYGHGIALMALAEALAMTAGDDPSGSDLYPLVERGTQFTCIAQHHQGSWGYRPKSPGDTTVTGWQVLSLMAAKRSRVPLQTATLSDAKNFVMSTCTDRDYWFGYKSPPGEPTTTAIGLTLMLYLGDRPDYTPMMMALAELADRGPTRTNIYHDYYATLALHHARHRDWERWNQQLRDHLVRTQVKGGHENGSWHFKDRWGDIGGRLYTTAMCVLTLEVYYRYLPLYGEIEDFPL